jgi:hypothetical protein
MIKEVNQKKLVNLIIRTGNLLKWKIGEINWTLYGNMAIKEYWEG